MMEVAFHRSGAGAKRALRDAAVVRNRLRELREAKGLTLEEVARLAETSVQQLSRLERGDRKMTAAWMGRLATVLDVPPAELISWEEDLPEQQSTRAHEPERTVPPPSDSTPERDNVDFDGKPYVPLPIYDVTVSAGPGAMNVERPEPDSWQLFALDWVRGVTRARLSDLALVRVSGDSMANTLQNGDLILVDRAVRRVGRDGLYVLSAGIDVQVKRISRDWATRTLTVTSDNPAYSESRGVQEDDIIILGRVVWLSRNLGG